MRKLGLLVAVLFLGCGGSGADTCAPRTGLYRVTFATQSGNCGDVPETVQNADTGNTITGCTGTRNESADMCSVSVDETCPSTDGSSWITMRGSVDWSDDGSSGVGTLYFEVRDMTSNLAACSGVYQVSYRRL